MDNYFGSTPHHHDTVASHYRAIYFAVIDTVTSTIKDRFDHPDYRVYANLEVTLLNGANGKNFEDTVTILKKNYHNEFDFVQLKIQLESLSCSFKDHSSNDVSLGDVVNHLRLLTQGQRLLLDQIMKLAQYCLVMPASNATSERSFSAMRCIKTYLRNSMTQNRLNHNMCINVHSEKVDSINLKLLLNEFIDTNDRRKQMFTHM